MSDAQPRLVACDGIDELTQASFVADEDQLEIGIPGKAGFGSVHDDLGADGAAAAPEDNYKDDPNASASCAVVYRGPPTDPLPPTTRATITTHTTSFARESPQRPYKVAFRLFRIIFFFCET